MAVGRFVAYYQVSTDQQGRSGLGLEAQREAVRSFLNGGNWSLADEVTEVESGKRTDRPELDRALRLCRLYGATLVVAKLDRLARNVAFISKLMESGVDFVAADFPQANRLTILAAVAEHEAAMISVRTKAALDAAKARGVKLGNPANLHNQLDGSTKGNAAKTANAAKRAADLLPLILPMKADGASLRQIADGLNRCGVPAPRGGDWSAVAVKRILDRHRCDKRQPPRELPQFWTSGCRSIRICSR
jgi:DNA invertase Pin-like site-specific DNA recombinase